MLKEENFIVAIELGSSKITAIAGRKQPDGAILVLATVQESSDSFIRKGRINNFNKMTTSLKNMKSKLEDKLQMTISAAYVGIGGMGMHTVKNTVTQQLSEKMLITADMVNSVKDLNISRPGNDKVILEDIPQDYKLGTQTVLDPVGIASESIEGHFLNIIASSSITKDVESCFTKAGINVVSTPITVLSLADAILTEPERRSGCVFVDMGAETTSVAIYKNNLLRHFAVIPLGGGSITRDIASVQIDEAEAEELKRKLGNAFIPEGEDNRAPIHLSDGRELSHEEFDGLVTARAEEIVLNIKNQIKLSGYDKSQLIAGIIVTGGASILRNLDKAFVEFTGFDKVRFVKSLRLQYRLDGKGAAVFNADGSFDAAIALVDKGDINCCGGKIGENKLFDEDEDNTQNAAQQGIAQPFGGTAQAGAQTEAQAGGQSSEQAAEQAVEAPTEAKEEKPKAPKGPSKLNKFWNKLKGAATRIVSEEEDHFPGTKED
ncbi:MAG: cell division protein FtsA [Alloprevotella sp.]